MLSTRIFVPLCTMLSQLTRERIKCWHTLLLLEPELAGDLRIQPHRAHSDHGQSGLLRTCRGPSR